MNIDQYSSTWIQRINNLAYPRQAGSDSERTALNILIKEFKDSGINCRVQKVPIRKFSSFSSSFETTSVPRKLINSTPVGFSGTLNKIDTEMVYTEKTSTDRFQGDLSGKIALVFGPVRFDEYKALIGQNASGLVIIGEPGRPLNYFCFPTAYVDACGQLPTVSINFDDGLWLVKNAISRVSLIIDQKISQGETNNLVVTVPRSGAITGNVIIGAHFDTVQNVPGVQDNLATCILMADLAKEFLNAKGLVDLNFVWFGGEELGGMEGSFHFIQNEPSLVSNTRTMINLDGTGGIIGVNGVRVMGNEAVNYLVKKVASTEKENWHFSSDCYWSDGIPFCEAGIPVVNIYRDDGTYFYAHSIQDTIDQVNIKHLIEYFRFSYNLISSLSNDQINYERKISKEIRRKMTSFYKHNLGLRRIPQCF
jgi:Iap family predicted aminopeptidase